MAFCKYSSESTLSSTTQVDNVFISEFLPNAPDVCVKVYLYGLYKCQDPNAFDNTLESFSSKLGLTPQDIEEAFLFWQEMNLVEVVIGTSFQVRYLPPKNALSKVQKFSKSKYADFNKKAQALLEGRMITPTEYTEYYAVMETFNIDPNAFLLIIDYCINLKGKNVGYSYINTVARNWGAEGITTEESILEKIKNYSTTSKEISKILKVCSLKRNATPDEQDKFLKWTQSYGFSAQTILFVADQISQKTGKATFQKIDAKLTGYYEVKRISIDEICDFEEHKTLLLQTAKNVCKNIGVYYENLEPVVEKYISHWFDLGHTSQSLTTLANFCFKNSTRTLDGLDTLVMRLYKKGIVSEEAIDEYLVSIVKQDAEVKAVLSRLGITRNVNSQDREFFKTWKYTWNMPSELFDLAIEKSMDKTIPMQYMNKLLSTWHSKGVSTAKDALALLPEKPQFEAKTPAVKKEGWEREYGKEQLEALFDSLEDIEI